MTIPYLISPQTQKKPSLPSAIFAGDHYTPLTFAFANSVAEGVFNRAGLWNNDRGEPRYLTCSPIIGQSAWTLLFIQGSYLSSPPIVHSGRMHPIERKIRHWLTPGMSGVERLGAWDYYFGGPISSRQFNQWIMKPSVSLRSRSGYLFSQLPAFWGLDGAKAWLSSQLFGLRRP